jgi:hypothetical protein
VSRAVSSPSGWPPPATATLAGRLVELRPLAMAISNRYFAEFPDDLETYGEAARDWEVHDTAHCLHWAILDAEGLDVLSRQVAWLKRVLAARDFPLEHLARNLELAADVMTDELGHPGAQVAERLRAAAALVRTQ